MFLSNSFHSLALSLKARGQAPEPTKGRENQQGVSSAAHIHSDVGLTSGVWELPETIVLRKSDSVYLSSH